MKKFLSVSLSATLLFGSFAGIAGAAELSTQEKFEIMKEAGIWSGIDGEAAVDLEMKRAELATILAKLHGLDEQPEAAEYSDVKDSYWGKGWIGAVTEAGLMAGTGYGYFGPEQNVTFEELATVVAKAEGLEESDAAVDGEVSDWADGWVAAALEAGLIPEQDDYTVNALRGNLIDASYVLYEDLVQVDLAAEVKATGSKKIEVAFNQPVDTTKAKFEVKKGAINANVANVSFDADKQVATLELSSKLTEGNYTVNVSGLTETALSYSLVAANEKVADIQVLSKVAPLVNLDTTNDDSGVTYEGVRVAYKVTNQYGEDITATTSLDKSAAPGSAGLDPSKGVVTITGSFKVNDIVTLSLIHPATATAEVATLTVSLATKVAEVDIVSLYNKDNKSLTEDTNLSSDYFYLVVDAKDQYGNAVTNVTQLEQDLIIYETNNTIVDVDNAASAPEFTTVKVNGVDKPAIQVKAPAGGIKVGQNSVTLISTTSGKSDSFTITVAENVRANTITLTNPGLVAADEDTYVPVTVLDKAGNELKDVKILNNTTKGVKVTVGSTQLTNPFVLKDEVPSIKIPKEEVVKGYVSVIAITSSNNVATLTLDVKDKAVATVIRGVDSDFSKTFRVSSDKTIGFTDLVVEDQYGRVMSDDAVKAWLNASASGEDNRIEVTDESGTILSVTDDLITSDSDSTAKVTSAGDNGTEKITLTLYKAVGTTGVVAGSAAEVTLRVTDGNEFVSYTMDDIGTVFDEQGAGSPAVDNDDYDRAIKVYGVLSDGSKVQLSNGTEYTVTSINANLNSDVFSDSKIDAAALGLSYESGKSEVVAPITVTINKTGQIFNKDVTFSKALPKVAAAKFVATNDVDAASVTSATYVDVNSSNTYTIADFATKQADKLNLVVTDQYGVSKLVGTDGKVTFASGVDVSPSVVIVPVTGNIAITGNGLVGATVTSIEAGDEFDVTVTYPGGAQAKVRVKAD